MPDLATLLIHALTTLLKLLDPRRSLPSPRLIRVSVPAPTIAPLAPLGSTFGR